MPRPARQFWGRSAGGSGSLGRPIPGRWPRTIRFMSREELLTAAVDHCCEHGLADLSLRRLGTSIGSSHRMLIYHFGSRDGLVTAIVREVQERQREALAADLAELAG